MTYRRLPPTTNPGVPEFGYWQFVFANPLLTPEHDDYSRNYDTFRVQKTRLTTKLSQIPILDLQIPRTLDDEYLAYCREGFLVTAFYDGMLVFAGEIKRARWDSNNLVCTIQADGAVKQLGGVHVDTEKEFKSVTAWTLLSWLFDLVNHEKPETDWVFGWKDPEVNAQNGPEDYLSYTFTPGDCLTHFTNIMAILGYDWYVKNLGATSYSMQFYPRTGTPTVYDDRLALFADYDLNLKEIVTDIDRIKTKFIVTGGSSATAEKTAIYAGCHRNIAFFASNESYLADNLSATETEKFYVANNSGYDRLGGQVLLDEEIVWYGTPGVDADGPFIAITQRGYKHTTIAAHKVFTPAPICDDLDVFVPIDNPIAELDFLTATNGEVWIGAERVGYKRTLVLDEAHWVGYKWEHYKLQDVTRGLYNSPVYPHSRGIAIRDTGWTENNAEPGSAIALHGIRTETRAATGISDQDTLDRLAQSLTLFYGALQPWGKGTLRCPATHPVLEPGCWLLMTTVDPRTLVELATDYRLVGMTIDQATSTIVLDFGDNEEYVLGRLRGIDTALSLAAQKNKKPVRGTIVPGTTSADGTVARVNIGTAANPILRWIQLKGS